MMKIMRKETNRGPTDIKLTLSVRLTCPSLMFLWSVEQVQPLYFLFSSSYTQYRSLKLGKLSCLTPHPALACVTMNTAFTAPLPSDLVLCCPQLPWHFSHILYINPWASLSFPLGKCQSKALTIADKTLAHTT